MLFTELCRNYVVQCLIENNVSSAKLLKQFRMHYVELATQKFSSHVVEKCLRHYPESQSEIVSELLSVPNFEYLVHDPYGNYVIQTALAETKVGSKIINIFMQQKLLKTQPDMGFAVVVASGSCS